MLCFSQYSVESAIFCVGVRNEGNWSELYVGLVGLCCRFKGSLYLLRAVSIILTNVFKDNEYSPQQIQWALKPATQPTKTNKRFTLIALIPYTQTTCGWLKRMLAKHHIKSVLKMEVRIMNTAPGRYDEPLNLQHKPSRPTKDRLRWHSYLTPIQNMATSTEWWLNTTSKVSSTTKENLQLPSTCQGCFGIKDAGCVQHPIWIWPGLYWIKWLMYWNKHQRTK